MAPDLSFGNFTSVSTAGDYAQSSESPLPPNYGPAPRLMAIQCTNLLQTFANFSHLNGNSIQPTNCQIIVPLSPWIKDKNIWHKIYCCWLLWTMAASIDIWGAIESDTSENMTRDIQLDGNWCETDAWSQTLGMILLSFENMPCVPCRICNNFVAFMLPIYSLSFSCNHCHTPCYNLLRLSTPCSTLGGREKFLYLLWCSTIRQRMRQRKEEGGGEELAWVD